MASLEQRTRELEELVRDLDMVVYRLERPVPDGPEAAGAERRRIRRELERLRDQLDDLVRGL
jgi:hypothetical protein